RPLGRTGLQISVLSYGASSLGGVFHDIDESAGIRAVHVALDHGVNFIDVSRVRSSVDESMARLGVDYFDLVQCHDIEFADIDQIVNETLPTLHELKRAGKVGHVGVTGLPLRALRNVLDRVPEGTVETILSFCHYELNDTALGDMVPYLKGKSIGIINASPTGMGLLTERGAPGWHPASETIKEGCR